MATITVFDSAGATQTVAKVTATGATTGANALPVVLSSDDAMLGIVTETAPATDTASSGLNGRLQRIAQRITSLIAQIPAALGRTTSAGSLSVVTASDDALMGIVTETAPATDTASSGLNGRLQRIAQNLTTVNTTLATANAQLPAALGSTAAASSLGVTASTEDIARAGIITETAPATDTASSGLNGRLQRVAQRITSLIALLPAAIGRTTSAGSLSVVSASDDALMGIVTETAPATDTASSGLNGRLQRVAQRVTSLIALLPTALGQQTRAASLSVVEATSAFSAAVSLTRTADTNAYAAGDVVGSSVGATAALTFSSMGPASGRIMLTSVAFEIDAAAVISGETSYRLYLYNVTPPSATVDNAAWDIPSGDRASFLGYVDLGTPVDLGSTLYVETNAINKQILLAASGNLFGYLVTNGAYTPTSARVHVITLHALAL